MAGWHEVRVAYYGNYAGTFFTAWIQPSACNPIIDLDNLVDWLKRLYEVQLTGKEIRHTCNFIAHL